MKFSSFNIICYLLTGYSISLKLLIGQLRLLKRTRICWYFGISPTAGGGGLGRLRSSPPSWTWGLGLGRGGLELKLHEEESKYTEA